MPITNFFIQTPFVSVKINLFKYADAYMTANWIKQTPAYTMIIHSIKQVQAFSFAAFYQSLNTLHYKPIRW